jgi:hypothetical protein
LILPGSKQTAVAQRIIGVRSSIPEDRGESRLGRVSRLARQSESDAFVLPYTRDATSSMVSSGRAIVNSDAGRRGETGVRGVLEAIAFVGCPWPGARAEAWRTRPGGEFEPCRRCMSLSSSPRLAVLGSGDAKAMRSRVSEAESLPVGEDISFCRMPLLERSRPSLCADRVRPKAGGTDERAPGARTDDRARLDCVQGRSRWKRATAKKHTISTLKTMLGPAWRLMAFVRQKSAVRNTKL